MPRTPTVASKRQVGNTCKVSLFPRSGKYPQDTNICKVYRSLERGLLSSIQKFRQVDERVDRQASMDYVCVGGRVNRCEIRSVNGLVDSQPILP
jgi:hypothetical protein